MWKRLTVHSVLRYLFVSRRCTLSSSVAAKQPFSRWASDDYCYTLLPKTLTSALFFVVLFLQTAGSCAYRSVTARESRSDDFKKTDIYGTITRTLSWSSTSLFFQSWPEKSFSDTCDSITALKIPTWCFEHITHWTTRAEWIVVICEYR